MQALASLFACGQPGEPGFTPQAARCTASCKIPVLEHRETGICSCLLQSNPCEIFLCFAKAFGQPLKTTHRVVFLTLSFKSLLLSIEKQKRTSEFACPFCLAEKQGFEPWLRFSRTTPLAGEPLRPLGYFRRSMEKFSWRREWDSNPRRLAPRRFSRPVP